VQEAVGLGAWAAGFVTYEAAPAFDSALVTRAPGKLPLLWFGLYRRVREISEPELPAASFSHSTWTPSLQSAAFMGRIAEIKERIASGDTYQVNFTFRLDAAFDGDPAALLHMLVRSQDVPYAAYLSVNEFCICSGSPELFFEKRGSRITCRPMKGTAPRGVSLPDDHRQMRALHESVKDRAENVMIVDMIRNDLGRIARFGSVRVPRLFTVERYETLFQMTSTVTARTEASLSDLFRALFPCASVTGAPKASTMRIIAELETRPRGIYTGAIGYVAPRGDARFSVAIRTMCADLSKHTVEYGIGSGIVWDSRAQGEYDECLLKARVLLAPSPPFELLETMRLERHKGIFLRRRHVRRLCASARYFGFAVDATEIRRRLTEIERAYRSAPQRVRLLLSRRGDVRIEVFPLSDEAARTPWRIALATHPVDEQNRFLYHKTTNRSVYDHALAEAPACDDVILWNSRREIAEATRANVVAKLNGIWVTPPVSCGLLAGTYRADLLSRKKIIEQRITTDELLHAEQVCLINSVHKWIAVTWV